VPKRSVKHVCQVCGVEYATEADAVVCETQPEDKPCVKVGDIVLGGAGYGWFDGDKRWVSNLGVKSKMGHGNCFGACCTLQFFYVVTEIDRDEGDPHRIRYHLFTKAMTGAEGHRSGHTYNEGHILPQFVKRPRRAVVRSSKELLGLKSEHLI
jgi:hypothetical protein